jgi:hypothetical protein
MHRRLTASNIPQQHPPPPRRVFAQEQTLDPPAGLFLQHEPRRYDARIIEDKQVAPPQQLGQLRECLMCDRPIAAPVVQESRRRALRRRRLCDQLGRQVKIEVVCPHARVGVDSSPSRLFRNLRWPLDLREPPATTRHKAKPAPYRY